MNKIESLGLVDRCGVLRAKEVTTCTKTCAIQRESRIRGLNKVLGHKNDSVYGEWKYVCTVFHDKDNYCICGQPLTCSNILESSVDSNIRVALGSQCIKVTDDSDDKKISKLVDSRCECGKPKYKTKKLCGGTVCLSKYCVSCMMRPKSPGSDYCKPSGCPTHCAHGERFHKIWISKKGKHCNAMLCPRYACDPLWRGTPLLK